MKRARVLTVESSVVAVLALVAVEGCNLILGNESRVLDVGSGGTAGTATGGTFGKSTTAGAGQAGDGGAGDGEAGDGEAGDGQGGAGQAGASNSGSDAGAQGGAPDGAAGEDSGAGGEPEMPTGPLVAPTGVAFMATSETEGTVTWQVVDEATTYTVELATDPGFTENRMSAAETGPTTTFSGLKADTLYQVRVRANGSNDRMSAWSSASGTTPLNPPTELSLAVYVSQGATVGYSGLLWIEPPDDLNNPGAHSWYFARGTASAKCAAGTTVQYRFNANYDDDGRKNYTEFVTTNEAYIVRPNGRITFYAEARCVGPNNVSNLTPEISACRRRDNSAC